MTPASPTAERPAPPRPPAPASTIELPPIEGGPRLVALALGGGIALEVGLRGGLANLAVALGLGAIVTLLVTRPGVSTAARWTAVAACVPALFLTVRASPWLAGANLGAAIGLLAVALAFARSGSVLDTTPGQFVRRLGTSLGHGLSRPLKLGREVPRPADAAVESAQRIGRAVLLASPLLVALVVLLAGADVVFAGLIAPNVAIAPAAGHVALTLVLGAGLGLVALSVGGERAGPARSGTFGVTEIAVVLALAGLVLGLFVVSQLLATTDAGQRLVEEAGLTPAEYARSGFFQLCWASLVIVAYLGLARYLARPEALTSAVVRGLSAAVPILGLGLVAVSLRRMSLYDQAFGLTMLRLVVVGTTLWIGIVLLMIAARNLGAIADRGWLPGAAGLAALALLVIANLVNLEGFVVQHNVARATEGADVDTEYLGQLSDDATPAIAAARDRVADAELRDRLGAALGCDDDAHGVAALNLAAATASRVRAARCDTA